MLTIRLFRIGRKHQPSFKIIVTDKRNPTRAGRFVDQVGVWNPLTKQKAFEAEKIRAWIQKGAQPSKTIHNMLVAEKIIEGEKIDVHKKSKKEAPKTEAKPTEQKPVDKTA